MLDSWKFLAKFCLPLLLWVPSKQYKFFPIESLLSLEKYIRQKVFTLSVLHPFLQLFAASKVGRFCLKSEDNTVDTPPSFFRIEFSENVL